MCFLIDKNTSISKFVPFYIITDEKGVITFLSIDTKNFINKLLETDFYKNLFKKNIDTLILNNEIDIRDNKYLLNEKETNKYISLIINSLINL